MADKRHSPSPDGPGAAGPRFKGKPVSAWLAHLADRSRRTNWSEAIDALKRMGPAAVPVLVQWVRHEELPMRSAALSALATLRPKDPTVWPAVLEAFENPSSGLQFQAAGTLALLVWNGWKDPYPPDAVALLAGGLSDGSSGRWSAATHLCEIGPAAAPALPELIGVLGRGDAETRCAVVATLGHIGRKAARAVPHLVPILLNDKTAYVRRAAAIVLGDIGSQGKIAVPALVEALKDKNHEVRERAAESLGRFGRAARQAGPALNELLRDRKPGVRAAAEAALDQIKAR